MLDAARAADQSWPDRNAQFRRFWNPPPKKKTGPGDATRTGFVADSTFNEAVITTVVARRAIEFAMRRADELDRRADRLLQIGMSDAAERLSRTAWEIRAEVLA